MGVAEIERDLAPIAWAPRVNVSALTGRSVDKLVPALDAALALAPPVVGAAVERVVRAPELLHVADPRLADRAGLEQALHRRVDMNPVGQHVRDRRARD